MFVAGGNISEYNELMKVSVEDYLFRFKLFIDDLKPKSNGN